jgi:hypothetical protein
MAIAEVMLTCALALATPSFRGPLTAQAFEQEYKWIHSLLESVYPDHEFRIVPKVMHEVPRGYGELPMSWRGHRIYFRRRSA